MRAFYHMIRRLSPTLSCNKTLVINFLFFKLVIFLGYTGELKKEAVKKRNEYEISKNDEIVSYNLRSKAN